MLLISSSTLPTIFDSHTAGSVPSILPFHSKSQYLLSTSNPLHPPPTDLIPSKTTNMRFTLPLLALITAALGAPAPQNANRPVPEGACCVSNTSLKQDVCFVNGQSGRCVPSPVNGCMLSIPHVRPFNLPLVGLRRMRTGRRLDKMNRLDQLDKWA